MSKKKVKAVYPNAEIIAPWYNDKNAFIISTKTDNGLLTQLSHVCATPQSAWRSALNRIEGKVSRKKGDKTGRKAKMSIQLQPEHKERIERKHGSVQKFVNEMVQNFLTNKI